MSIACIVKKKEPRVIVVAYPSLCNWRHVHTITRTRNTYATTYTYTSTRSLCVHIYTFRRKDRRSLCRNYLSITFVLLLNIGSYTFRRANELLEFPKFFRQAIAFSMVTSREVHNFRDTCWMQTLHNYEALQFGNLGFLLFFKFFIIM